MHAVVRRNYIIINLQCIAIYSLLQWGMAKTRSKSRSKSFSLKLGAEVAIGVEVQPIAIARNIGAGDKF